MANVNVNLPDSDMLVELVAEKTRVEIQKLNGEISKLNAEKDAQDAIIRQLKADASMGELRLRELTQIREAEMSRDFYHRVYRLNGIIDNSTVKLAIDTLTIWNRLEEHQGKPIEIVFNSPGGAVDAGMELYDFIQELRRNGHYVTTAARGMAASMAGILLQAGDERVAGAETAIMLHEPATWVFGKTSAIQDEVDFLNQIQDRVLKIFSARSAEAFANGTSELALTADQFDNGAPEFGVPGWKRREWWLTAAESLRLGIVDKVR